MMIGMRIVGGVTGVFALVVTLMELDASPLVWALTARKRT